MLISHVWTNTSATIDPIHALVVWQNSDSIQNFKQINTTKDIV